MHWLLYTSVAAAVIGVVVHQLGLFDKLVFRDEDTGPWYCVGKDFVGPYHQVYKAFKDVEDWAKTHNLPIDVSIGLYYDNPDTTPAEQLRSKATLSLSKEQFDSLSSEVPLPDGWFKMVLPQRKRLVTKVPMRNMFNMIISIMRYYPLLSTYMQNSNLMWADEPCLEIMFASKGELWFAAALAPQPATQ